MKSTGKITATINQRVSKGYGIVSEFLALLEEIPLGRYKVEIGLKLRQALLLNGIPYNSEGWHAVKEEHIKALEKVDESLLRGILRNHCKTPLEFLFLETGSISIKHVISSRRMIFLQTIFSRSDNEITKKV